MSRSVRRITVVIASTLVGLFVLIVAVGLPLYVFPPAGESADADLVYVIGPPTPERVALERRLRDEGTAPLSLYSVATIGRYSADALAVCKDETVVCVHPQPFTTKGEIAYLEQFAAEHDIEHTVILTFTPHVARTRFIIDKCFDGEAQVMAVDQHLNLVDWAYQYAYQTAAFAKALLTPCADANDL